MSTRKRNPIRKAIPLLGAAATAGLFSMMGAAMAADNAAQPVSQIVLSDDADVTFVASNQGHRYSTPARIRPMRGKTMGNV